MRKSDRTKRAHLSAMVDMATLVFLFKVSNAWRLAR